MPIFLTGIAELIGQLYRAHRESGKQMEIADQWFKLGMSVFGTAFVTFFGMLGIVGGSTLAAGQPFAIAFFAGFFAACATTAAAVLNLWKRSALTRGIPILAPMKVEEKVLQDSWSMTEPAKTKN